MSKSAFILVLVITTGLCQTQDVIKFESDALFENGDVCDSVHNGVKVTGVCKPIQNCPIILADAHNLKSFEHTVCGYENKTQIICCPTATTNSAIQLRENVAKLNLKGNLECRVANSNETGVIKFLTDCPELNKYDASAHVNKFCTDEVCSDLVCCPVMSMSRLKTVCRNVDHPIYRLKIRLLLNQECTVKVLNIKGRYQSKYGCAYAERNPDSIPMLQDVCNDDTCNDTYCCPIEGDDVFMCTAVIFSEPTVALVGPKCIDSKSGRKGNCKRSFNCAHPDVTALDKCGSYCCDNFYCCPDNLHVVGQSMSSRECSSYTKYLFAEEVQVPMNLYVNQSFCAFGRGAAGGIIANPGQFPHMAALGYKPTQETVWKCGGSLISDRYVLTAGHCLTDRTYGQVQKVRLGVIDLLNDINTADCPEDFDVAKLIPHPEYNPAFVYNDIGLIELGAQVKFNYHIRPICLPPSGGEMHLYQSMGWGATGPAENGSAKLIKVDQEFFTYEECQEQYGVSRRYPNGIINDIHICAGSRDSIQSTCPGDSGGPLIGKNFTGNQAFYIQGIVSFGNACGFANSPGVYTRVFPYITWIENIVWKN